MLGKIYTESQRKCVSSQINVLLMQNIKMYQHH